jgi:hypothetical protein
MRSTRRTVDSHRGVWPETLALFAKLERQPPSARSDTDERELASALDLEEEWWCCQTVLNDHPKPCHPPSKGAHDMFWRCRAMREYLLDQSSLNQLASSGTASSPDATRGQPVLSRAGRARAT